MPRYNTSLDSNTITGTTTISSPKEGAFTQLTGTSGYTVTLPSPSAFPGRNFTFYNATSPAGVVTISTPSGSFSGIGGPNASTYNISAGNVISVTSDGSNYIVISEDGSPLTATTGAFTGNVEMTGGLSVTGSGTLSLNPASTGAINNVNIGASTRGTGAFTSLSANAAVTLTANTASSSTTTGTLVVTGGIGASGTVNATTVAATTLTGTVSTAAQPNITSLGTLSSLAVSGDLSATTVTGTLSTAAQPNVTSVGTLSSLNITGNVGVGTNNPAGRMTISDSTRTIDGLGNLNILTTTAQTTNAGGTLALGGQNGSAGVFDPWSFATLKGAKENSTANDLSGYFAVGTPSSGGTIVERIRVTSNGSVNIGSATNYGGLLSVNRPQVSGVANLLTLRDASAGTTFDLQTFGDPTFGTVNRFNYNGPYLSFRQSDTEILRLSTTANGGASFSNTRLTVNGPISVLGVTRYGLSGRIQKSVYNWYTTGGASRVHFKTNLKLTNPNSNVGMWIIHIHGYSYGAARVVDSYYGLHSDGSGNIYSACIQNQGQTPFVLSMYKSADNFLVIPGLLDNTYFFGVTIDCHHTMDYGYYDFGITAVTQTNNNTGAY